MSRTTACRLVVEVSSVHAMLPCRQAVTSLEAHRPAQQRYPRLICIPCSLERPRARSSSSRRPRVTLTLASSQPNLVVELRRRPRRAAHQQRRCRRVELRARRLRARRVRRLAVVAAVVAVTCCVANSAASLCGYSSTRLSHVVAATRRGDRAANQRLSSARLRTRSPHALPRRRNGRPQRCRSDASCVNGHSGVAAAGAAAVRARRASRGYVASRRRCVATVLAHIHVCARAAED